MIQNESQTQVCSDPLPNHYLRRVVSRMSCFWCHFPFARSKMHKSIHPWYWFTHFVSLYDLCRLIVPIHKVLTCCHSMYAISCNSIPEPGNNSTPLQVDNQQLHFLLKHHPDQNSCKSLWPETVENIYKSCNYPCRCHCIC